MAIPDYESLMLPLLRYVAEGERPVQNAISALAEQLRLSPDDKQALLPSGRTPVFSSRVHWAGTYLVQSGLLCRPRRGVLEVTERGKSVLAENPQTIDNELLARFPEFIAFRQRSRAAATEQPEAQAAPVPVAEILQDTPKQAPEERIDAAFQELTAALRAELLDRIRAAPPAFFEHLIVDLMLAMGYGAGGGGQQLGRPNDEGVDGVINEDALGLDTVYLQAKRYAADLVVGVKDIQAFIGALVGHGASKGVFVTTSHFSSQAREFARKASHQRVILIDGDELTRLLVRYGVGVRTARTIDLRRIDENYFDPSE
jgi:restriction system protein